MQVSDAQKKIGSSVDTVQTSMNASVKDVRAAQRQIDASVKMGKNVQDDINQTVKDAQNKIQYTVQQAQSSLEKSIQALTDKIEQVNQLTIANTKARENEKDFEEKLRTAFTIKVEPRLVDAHGKDVQREINSVEPFSANFGGSMSTQK